MTQKPTAVFDVDGTLLQGDCLLLAARRSLGIFGQVRASVALLPWLLAWQLRQVSTERIKERTLRAFRICDAVNRAEAVGQADWLLAELEPRLRPEALRRLRWHQNRGDRVLLCSASPRILLQPLADRLGVELLATELRRRNGCWQPLLEGPNCKGPEKMERLRAHLGPLEGITLEAYGDSRGDRELLQAATRPHYRSFGPDCRPYPFFRAMTPTSRSTPIASAFVLGSTSEVARALSRELARRGCRRFHLVARDAAANQVFASELQEQYGAAVTHEQTDLHVDASLDACSPRSVGEFDLYLITAGSLGEAERARENANDALKITAANYGGLLPWLTAIATPERLTRRSRLWVFSSVAADRGRPSNYHYGAAKAALTTFCEGLLLRCHGKPFAVRILKAGFMATPMTVGKAPPALCASPAAVARDLLRRPDRRGIEYLPWWWAPLMQLIRLLPASLASRL